MQFPLLPRLSWILLTIIFFLPIIIAFMQLLTYCTECSAHTLAIQFAIAKMNESAYKRYSNTLTQHTIQRRSNHCVVCLRSLYQFYYYIYSMIIISDSLHFSHSVALYWMFFRCALWVHWTNRHKHTCILQENALFHAHTVSVRMVYFACEMMCAVLQCWCCARSLAARCSMMMMKWTVKGRATLKWNLQEGEDGKGEIA